MASATTEDGLPAPTFRSHCPACPTSTVTGHAASWIIDAATQSSSAAAVTPLRIRQVEAGYRISFSRSRQKRGPPSVVLS